MGRWGDDVDEELQQDTDIKPRFMISFKSMINALNNISESMREYDEKHPKDNFHMIWMGTMTMMFLFLCFTFNILCIVTIPFICFYAFVLVKLYSSYKQFGYKRTWYWPTTVVAIGILVAVSILLRKLLGI